MRLILLVASLVPIAATASINSADAPRRNLRPEHVSNDHENAPYITVDDSTDDGANDDNEERIHKHEDPPLKQFQHVNFNISSHFKGWADLRTNDDFDLPILGDDNINVGQPLGQHNFPIGKGNDRFCGYTFDNAVDKYCRSPISCQFQRCPSGMTCYVLSEGVMTWCDDEDGDDTGVVETEDGLHQNEAELSSSEPTEGWSEMPVEKPSTAPTLSPLMPSNNPTSSPSVVPTSAPSSSPIESPSLAPTGQPTKIPTEEPSFTPTWTPTITPSTDPTLNPTTTAPTVKPSNGPTESPTEMPTAIPTTKPSIAPITSQPSNSPSFSPTSNPTAAPTKAPTRNPTAHPITSEPTGTPSAPPTDGPSSSPTLVPSNVPTAAPVTSSPSSHPTTAPSQSPSNNPTVMPSETPTDEPTVSATTLGPSNTPTLKPSDNHSASPVLLPTLASAQFSPQTETEKPSKRPSPEPTANPVASSTLSPSTSPTLSPSVVSAEAASTDPTLSPSFSMPSVASSTKPSPKTSSSPIASSTQHPSVNSIPKPTESQSTNAPSQPGTSEATINMKNPDVLTATTSPSSSDTTRSPSATLHPNDKFWKSPEPTMKVTPAPTFLLQTPEPTLTQFETVKPTDTKQTVAFPKIDYVLLSTQGDLSEDAVANVELAVRTFLLAELGAYYENSFAGLNIISVEDQAVTRDLDLKRRSIRRQLSEVTGTKVLFDGDIIFDGQSPTESDVSEALIAIGEASNEYLVSNITSTGDPELQDVVIVLVEASSDETSTPSVAPSVWVEEFVRTPDGIVESDGTEEPTEARTSIIIVSICGVAALTMLLFVFATKSRSPLKNEVEEDATPAVKPSRDSQQRMPPSEIDVESAEASAAKSFHGSHNETVESGYYLNDNEASTIVSSVTDWNDYVTVDSRKAVAKSHVEVVNGSRSHEDVVATWFDTHKGKTAAELNNIGTRTLERNDESVVPKTWSLTSSGQNVPTRFSLGAKSASSTRRGEESDSDDSSVAHDGGFPSLNGSFPTARQVQVDSREFQMCGSTCGAEAIYNDLDSSVDYSARSAYSAVGDWSHIGTVDDELLPNCGGSYSQASKRSAESPGIQNVPSHDTKDTSTSLNRFISDLVWLEKKITDENDAAKVRQAVELTLKESDIQCSDSYSYQCDSFSPRSNSSMEEEEDATTISSRQASQAMSIICRDCFVPPGDFKIDVVSTVDGPMINGVDEELNGHLGKGDLIIAVDDCDTRALSAEEVLSMILSRSSLERKLTVLQFGGSASMMR